MIREVRGVRYGRFFGIGVWRGRLEGVNGSVLPGKSLADQGACWTGGTGPASLQKELLGRTPAAM
jgi:hypothetical protein